MKLSFDEIKSIITDTESPLGDFDSVGELIADLIRDIEGVAVIGGRQFVPEDTSLFGDFRLLRTMLALSFMGRISGQSLRNT